MSTPSFEADMNTLKRRCPQLFAPPLGAIIQTQIHAIAQAQREAGMTPNLALILTGIIDGLKQRES